MKTHSCAYLWYAVLFLGIVSIGGCSKGDSGGSTPPPEPEPKKLTLVTNEVQRISRNGYQCKGDITEYGTVLPILERGICWGTKSKPTKDDNFYASSNLLIDFLLPILNAKETYYVRAYAVNSEGITYGNEVSFSTPLDLGFLYQGGIIFDYDSTYAHGLVAATYDQGENIPWAPGNLFTTTTGAQSTWDGYTNTLQIINTYGDAGTYAAKLCHDYHGGGYTDWYLPSANEVVLMQLRQDAIGGFPPPDQFTLFLYWSSTEYDYFRADVYQFNSAYTDAYADQKNSQFYVRAIRAF